MASVWYIGPSDSRTISGAEWTAAGITGSPATSTWSKANGYSIPTTSFTAPQLTILGASSDFNTAAPDGPRPGAAVATDDKIIRNSDLVNAGVVGLAQWSRDLRIKLAEGAAACAGKLGPALVAGTDYTALSFDVGFGPMGAYTNSYAAFDGSGNAKNPLWPGDLTEGLEFVLSNWFSTYGSEYVMNASHRFMCDGDKFAFYTNDGISSGMNFGLMIYVDGRPMSLTPNAFTATAGQFTTLTFPTAKVRMIEVRTIAQIGAVYTALPYKIWKPPPRKGPRVLVMGDSYVQALATPSNYQNGCYQNIGPHIGTEDVWIDGIGGTGYGVTSDPGGVIGSNRYMDRIVPKALGGQTWDVQTINPDMVVVHGGGANDKFKSRSNAQVIADAVSVMTTLRAKLPYAKLVFVEGFSPPGFTPATYNPNYIAIRAGMQAALTSVGVYYVDVATTDPWLYGSGHVGATNGSGNADVYIGADTLHPVDAGYLYMRGRLGPKLKRIMQDSGALLNQLV